MSYDSAPPPFPPDPAGPAGPAARPRRARGAVLIGAAALVPACFAGWLLWQAAAGGPDSPGGNRAGSGGVPGPAASAGSVPGPRPPGGTGTGSPDKPPSPAGEKGDDGGGDGKAAGGPAAGERSGPLSGKVVVIDPGHNPGNRDHTSEIAESVDIGTNRKECDTTGTATNSGYPEAEFTLDVSRRVRALLEQQGATVEFTQDGDRPYGPCVDERARIGNKARADAVVSVHADGSGAGNRGFHVILPGRVKQGAADTSAIVEPSRELGERIAGNFVRETGSAPSNYIGGGTGLDVRSDLGGLNLSKVPKVFIECGNMRDPQEAARLTSGEWRQSAARGIAEGLESFLKSTG